MKMTLSKKWKQFAATLEALGYEVECQMWDRGNSWYIWQNGEIMFELYNHSAGYTTTDRDGVRVEHHSAKKARNAAYQWLLQRHCVIGMGVATA
ncbi:hypothetical protein CIG75_19190 [Tumebacillus algifaecis]|uniref:Uncharacterized protein n=1 Tax=Tumebacillus algifaecis TaxID=1214604 RepID=A0A223D5H5_9BACL|nr:hypothetical protein [Tumebacillus algifaecis]ASS76859.1 hypothetical protein CIG75_19190 [Tumebacillus algifaecis]